MAMFVSSYKANWKKVKGDYKKEKQICERCSNEVQYELCKENEGLGFGGLVMVATKNFYVYKCPICPNIEPLSNEVAKAIMKG
jgi:hypothetical protein